MQLFHVSETAGIEVFQPRRSSLFPELGPLVWSIDAAHLANYLLPRDCPRVTFTASSATTREDRTRFSVDDVLRVVVIEQNWFGRVLSATVHVYELPSDGFRLHDQSAGYWIAKSAVRPLGVCAVSELPTAMGRYGASLRVEDNLWPLHDAVIVSTLDYSMIRMRHAACRIVP